MNPRHSLLILIGLALGLVGWYGWSNSNHLGEPSPDQDSTQSFKAQLTQGLGKQLTQHIDQAEQAIDQLYSQEPNSEDLPFVVSSENLLTRRTLKQPNQLIAFEGQSNPMHNTPAASIHDDQAEMTPALPEPAESQPLELMHERSYEDMLSKPNPLEWRNHLRYLGSIRQASGAVTALLHYDGQPHALQLGAIFAEDALQLVKIEANQLTFLDRKSGVQASITRR